MSKLKKLAGETVIYGVSTILGRLLNWLLMPFYIRTLDPEQFGGVVNIYSYIAVLLVLLTFGFETGFFRFATKNNHKSLIKSLSFTVGLFSIVLVIFNILFSNQIHTILGNEFLLKEYFIYAAVLVGIDAVCSLPFAELRFLDRTLKYAGLRFFQVILTILFNVFYLVLCPYLLDNGYEWVNYIYNPLNRLKYVFVSNLISSGLIMLVLLPSIFRKTANFDFSLVKSTAKYSYPIMIVGLFGMLILNVDKILMPHLLNKGAMEALAIYGANFKIGVLMALFIQSYRLAFEPFFFKEGKNNASKELYAVILKYFVIFGILIYVGVLLLIDVVNLLLLPDYIEGNIIIPYILLGQLFFGIYYSLSLWYKLTDRTHYGAYISGFGAFLVLILNLILVPKFGYLGAAISSFICFLGMMVVSYLYGQKFYPINYPLKTILAYILSGILLVKIVNLLLIDNDLFYLAIKGFIFVSYVFIIFKIEHKAFNKVIS
ncbi:lipopolysaccharide biosynthesis protein [Carboxylicivirga sp. N1Y90]|uniref:lipopolysaccharide biosynthesis protein n=1 Tax=Carboxylicivirga fragile TaxID=3417571 RepID=UPI003D34E4CC|nr:polysaccharide biosynthesis C-terminal domain-containing protein [Marinilabiliaceae bacterium N1Y90]